MKYLEPLETIIIIIIIIIIIYIFFIISDTHNYNTLLHLQFITITSNYRGY